VLGEKWPNELPASGVEKGKGKGIREGGTGPAFA